MQFKIPKSDKYQWTRHAMYKMQQYGLSPQRIARVIRNPQRLEEGIAKNTIAVMQPASVKIKDGKKTWSQEIWAMYQTRKAGNPNFQIPRLDSRRALIDARRANNKQISNYKQCKNFKLQNLKIDLLMKLKANEAKKLRIISALRYPGVSPKNNPIPDEILGEISDII